MLRSLLTPLVARFEAATPRLGSSPLAAPLEVDEETPEDFEHDARIEAMRVAVETVKVAEAVDRKVELTAEIHRIMVEDAATKDVFRELDGFLVLVNVLATLRIPEDGLPEDDDMTARMEAARLAFAIISEAIRDHPVNKDHFERQVGFEALRLSILTLVSDPRTVCQTFGFVLALSLQNFSLANIFMSLRSQLPSPPKLDAHISQFEHRFGTVRSPKGILVLLKLLPLAPKDEEGRVVTYSALKIIERLAASNHRNQALLNGAGIISVAFDRLFPSATDPLMVPLPDDDERASLSSFSSTAATTQLAEAERAVLLRLLRRMLDMGAGTPEARQIYQRVVRPDAKLHSEILEILKSGKRAKWPEHFSFDGSAALSLKEDSGKIFPCPNGFTFMAWVYVDKYPTDAPSMLFGVKHPNKWTLKLSLRPYGKLELSLPHAKRDPIPFDKSIVPKSKWTHVTLVFHAARGTNPSIRLFIDGTLVDTLDFLYPRIDNTTATSYLIGDPSPTAQTTWLLASAYLFSLPLPHNDLPRLFHHLGPRYTSNFQSPSLVRFLTYEGSTSLNIYLSSMMTSGPSAAIAMSSAGALIRAIREGLGIMEESIVFAINPSGTEEGSGSDDPSAPGRTGTPMLSATNATSNGINGAGGRKPNPAKVLIANAAWRKDRPREKAVVEGDVVVARPQCLDVALWKIGGAAIPLRIVEMAETSDDLFNALSLLADSVRTNWQNSEDMERIRGYELLAYILRSKSKLITLEAFHTIFEFLGLDFDVPENSTITNAVAYHYIALDFELWSSVAKDIQIAHLDHFTTLLETSRFKKFNFKQRFSKLSLVRKLLFVLQTDLYSRDVVPRLIETLTMAVQHNFVPDASIKPVISYLAANLHDEPPSSATPRSIMSRVDVTGAREKAEQVLEALVYIVTTPSNLERLSSALPISRVCLLLLGEHPSPVVASQILILIGLVLNSAPAFNRKFELVSGWSILKSVIPGAWDPSVHVAAFDLLLGRVFIVGQPQSHGPPTIKCPHILPTILASLAHGLDTVISRNHLPPTPTANSIMSPTATFAESSQNIGTAMEVLIEEIIDLHSSMLGFRALFQSKQTTAILIDACKSFMKKLGDVPHIRLKTVRISEKLAHLALMLALDNSVDHGQKRQFLEILSALEASTTAAQTPPSHHKRQKSIVDPTLIALPLSPGLALTQAKNRTKARLSLQVVGERTFQKSINRIAEWRSTISATEQKRLKKMMQDQREHHRHAERQTEWRFALHAERGLWPQHQANRVWRLDETEGPFRVRKKLEPEHVKVLLNARVQAGLIRDVKEPDAPEEEVVAVEVPPWAESYEFSSTAEADDDPDWQDELTDDKHRRVRHELEAGDVIEEVRNVTRVAGVDASPGLLILGKTHLYMLDGLLEREDGEIIEAQDAPKDIFLVPGTVVELDGIQRAQRWPYDQVATFSKRTCLFRDVALEIYMKDSRSFFVVFQKNKDRQDIHAKLVATIQQRGGGSNELGVSPQAPAQSRTPLFTRARAQPFTGLKDEILTAQRKWQAREISNFAYISIMNQTSGRTRCDVTQYPVFPWVLADYSSETLDLDSDATYRDLSLPMGALTPARQEAAVNRYTSLEGVGEVPFHYGTHYSSSMIVCHFLIRLSPFTHMFKTLQGGDWDLPDRLFSGVRRAYESASQDSRGDVRELIPEFFTSPEFLENSARLDFGRQSSTGEVIDDVKLPPWAKDDPFLFISLHRQALESDYVSKNLPAWIDLIWGCKQKDPQSFNVFHPLSYEGAIDLDTITNPHEREATVGIIHNFGQTPRKLFTSPHPPRIMEGVSTLPLGTICGIPEDYHLLLQGSRPVRNVTGIVESLMIDSWSEKILPCTPNMLYVPNYPHEEVRWGFSDQSLRLHIDKKVVHVAEAASCTCATFANSEILITGSDDSTVGLWRLGHSDISTTTLTLTHILRGHTDTVLCVAASRPWSLIVSGSQDSTVIIWDLNRAQYVRSISHETPVSLVAINEATGYIATCSRDTLSLHTINSHLIASYKLSQGEIISSIAFHEREWSKIGVLATGAVGSINLRSWNTGDTPPGEKAKWSFASLREFKCRKADGGEAPTVTSLKFVGEALYSGDNAGKVYSWELPD